MSELREVSPEVFRMFEKEWERLSTPVVPTTWERMWEYQYKTFWEPRMGISEILKGREK